jgi:DNA-binding FadR family transcriptional regulator
MLDRIRDVNPCGHKKGTAPLSLHAEPLKVNYAYQQIADRIQEQILEGCLKPGEKLPGEMELAQMFGVTRSTVREGLRQLEQDGFVFRPSPRRLEVRLPAADQLSSRAGRAMALMKVTFRELWQVTMETEPLAAKLAVQRATEAEIAELQCIHDRLVAAKGDLDRTVQLDTQFHSAIAEYGKNRVLNLAREPIALLLFQGLTQIVQPVPQSYARQITAHGNILNAIRDRDADQASFWARKHIQDFWRGVCIAGLEDAPAIKNPKSLTT